MVGRVKKQTFQGLKNYMHSQIENLCVHPLSQDGKEVFIKSVLQAIHIFTMPCFLLPTTFYVDLEKIIKRFLWKRQGGQGGMHWCNWFGNLPFLPMKEYLVCEGVVQYAALSAYLLKLDVINQQLHGRLIGVERWRPSDLLFVKVNFDATYSGSDLFPMHILSLDITQIGGIWKVGGAQGFSWFLHDWLGIWDLSARTQASKSVVARSSVLIAASLVFHGRWIISFVSSSVASLQLWFSLEDVKGSFKSTFEGKSFEDLFFLNTDGAVQIESGNAAVGGVVHNANGDWILGYNRHLGKCSIFNAEL
ncbi:hypothetical protein PVK06_039104 [Gossypium arboreum]|uniref:Uncharacterized protein n=1 Tax=Gossypium arboreum TaxID=29729 RepID=A0ABR0N205_GOSAR|nr:hypothetical protein PVK06_039104 [Gossypium arboreum]